MNNQQPHSVINSMAGLNQRGIPSSQPMYQMQQSTMAQMSHVQQHQHSQPQQQQPHMMSSYSGQKSSDVSSRQYSPSMSTLNGSTYQPLTGSSLHPSLNMDSNRQMNVQQQQHNDSSVHQYSQQQQQHHHQYQPSMQQQHHQPYHQSNIQNQHQHQQQMHNQKQISSHVVQQQQPNQYNKHQGNQSQQQASHHSQMQSMHQPQSHQQQQQPYVQAQQQRNAQHHHHQTQQHQPKYEQAQQPRRILVNTDNFNHHSNQRPLAKESSVKLETMAVAVQSKDAPSSESGAGDSAVVHKADETKNMQDSKQEDHKVDQTVTDKSDSATENKGLANTKEKTPMTLVQELARFNQIEIKYTLLDEQGPAHKKTFFVKLLLGTEEYSSSGASIRKAQSAAAAMAMKETKYESPPEKKPWRAKRDLALTEDGKLTPTVELNGLAMKRGESAIYKAIEPQQPPYYYPPGMDPRAMYSPRYYQYLRASRDPRFARGYWPMRYHYPRMSRAFYVSLRVGHREFIGDGPTRQAARHNAAIKALKVLKNLPQKEKVEEPEPVVEEINEEEDELKSKVTSVHEIAFRRNFQVEFEVIRESGPPHMKNFVTRCTVGDMVTEGEGNSKKSSKKVAAEKMYEKFKELGPLPQSAVNHKPRTQVYKKKRSIGIKADIQQQKADPNYGSGVNPISRLIQIMCAQKKKEPVYTLVAETGIACRREFVMQIEVLDKTCTGIGPNKKLAKRAAAEAMLECLGYNKPTPQPAKSSFKQHSIEANGEKKVTFSENCEKGVSDVKNGANQQKVPGLLHLPSKTIMSAPSASIPANPSPSLSSINSTKGSPAPAINLSAILKPNWRPELQLRELCNALKYPLDIEDFTKGQTNNSIEYVSRIHVGNGENHQTFLGSSNSLESARTNACMEALKVLVSRVKDMHPAGDSGNGQMKKSVLSRSSPGVRGDLSQ